MDARDQIRRKFIDEVRSVLVDEVWAENADEIKVRLICALTNHDIELKRLDQNQPTFKASR